MFKKIINRIRNRFTTSEGLPDITKATYTYEEAMEVYRAGVVEGHKLGYAEGKADGIAIAKRAAQNQLRELTRR